MGIFCRITYGVLKPWKCLLISPRSDTQRNLFGILLNQTEIRLYLLWIDWFGTINGQCPFAVPNQSRKMVNTIWFHFDLIRFRKDFTVCIQSPREIRATFYPHSRTWIFGFWNYYFFSIAVREADIWYIFFIMGDQFEGPLKPLGTTTFSVWYSRGLMEALNWPPMMARVEISVRVKVCK